MTEPSDYELDAWRNIQLFKGRPLTQAMRNAGGQVALGAEKLGKRATEYLESHPGAQTAVSSGQEIVAKSARTISTRARKVSDAVPDGMTEWGGTVLASMRQTVGRVSRVGLSPKAVVKKHKKRGHDVNSLFDLRRLDLEQIDAVRGRGASWGYPIAAAASGAVAGAVITGGEIVTVASAGAAAAPSGTAIASAFFGDAAVVLGLASRCVGEASLLYGYDPEEPAEKLFIMSVVNAGTAMSASAKTAAMADVSRLTQALVRGKTWAVLDKSLVAQVSKQFAKAFGNRLTKQGLGKVVPAAGTLIGLTLNWATLESIVDVANIEYRKRFLLEKYPQLADWEAPRAFTEAVQDTSDGVDEEISVLGELAEAGGPDLR